MNSGQYFNTSMMITKQELAVRLQILVLFNFFCPIWDLLMEYSAD
jgi:hypothetical protein